MSDRNRFSCLSRKRPRVEDPALIRVELAEDVLAGSSHCGQGPMSKTLTQILGELHAIRLDATLLESHSSGPECKQHAAEIAELALRLASVAANVRRDESLP